MGHLRFSPRFSMLPSDRVINMLALRLGAYPRAYRIAGGARAPSGISGSIAPSGEAWARRGARGAGMAMARAMRERTREPDGRRGGARSGRGDCDCKTLAYFFLISLNFLCSPFVRQFSILIFPLTIMLRSIMIGGCIKSKLITLV
jgi:hypothetical protein